MSTTSDEPVDVEEDADGSQEAAILSAEGKPTAASSSTEQIETRPLNINQLREQLSAQQTQMLSLKQLMQSAGFEGRGEQLYLTCSS